MKFSMKTTEQVFCLKFILFLNSSIKRIFHILESEIKEKNKHENR